MLSAVKTGRVETPTISNSSSGQSANVGCAVIAADSTPANDSHFKSKALERDSHRCLISGILDRSGFKKDIEDRRVCPTQAAHIIPFYLAQPDDPKGITQEVPCDVGSRMVTNKVRYIPTVSAIELFICR